MNLNSINAIFTGFVIVLCVVFSYFLLFTDLMIDTMHGTKRTVFVIVLLSYGAFRGYRLIRSFKEGKESKPE